MFVSLQKLVLFANAGPSGSGHVASQGRAVLDLARGSNLFKRETSSASGVIQFIHQS